MAQGTTIGPWTNGSGNNGTGGAGSYDVDFRINSVTVNPDGSAEFDSTVVEVYGVGTTYEAVRFLSYSNANSFISGTLASRTGMSGSITNGDNFTVTLPASDDVDIESFFAFNNTSDDVSNMAEYYDLRVQYFGSGGYRDSNGSLSGQGEEADDANTVINLDVVCFAKGTLIKTEQGQIPVEDLSVGTRVWILDHGFHPIRWISGNTVPATNKTRPVLIKKNALGLGHPKTDLSVSQQHRIMASSSITEDFVGEQEVLVAAKHLIGTAGIELDRTCKEVTYYHFIFDKHEIVSANGALCESFFPGPVAINSLEEACRDELLEIFPDLKEEGNAPLPARLFLNGRTGKRLTRKHINRVSSLFSKTIEHNVALPSRQNSR